RPRRPAAPQAEGDAAVVQTEVLRHRVQEWVAHTGERHAMHSGVGTGERHELGERLAEILPGGWVIHYMSESLNEPADGKESEMRRLAPAPVPFLLLRSRPLDLEPNRLPVGPRPVPFAEMETFNCPPAERLQPVRSPQQFALDQTVGKLLLGLGGL